MTHSFLILVLFCLLVDPAVEGWSRWRPEAVGVPQTPLPLSTSASQTHSLRSITNLPSKSQYHQYIPNPASSALQSLTFCNPAKHIYGLSHPASVFIKSFNWTEHVWMYTMIIYRCAVYLYWIALQFNLGLVPSRNINLTITIMRSKWSSLLHFWNCSLKAEMSSADIQHFFYYYILKLLWILAQHWRKGKMLLVMLHGKSVQWRGLFWLREALNTTKRFVFFYHLHDANEKIAHWRNETLRMFPLMQQQQVLKCILCLFLPGIHAPLLWRLHICHFSSF